MPADPETVINCANEPRIPNALLKSILAMPIELLGKSKVGIGNIRRTSP